MPGNLAPLRLKIEHALSGRVPAPFTYRDRKIVETVLTGIPEIDSLTGGLPRGCLTEICGPSYSGRTSLLLSALAARTAQAEVCALVDGYDAFDPASAKDAGVALQQLLWVRCHNIEQTLRAADLLIQGGGFGLIALDLSDIPSAKVRCVPLSSWFRLRRAVENTPTILVVLEQEPNAKTCASLILNLATDPPRWATTLPSGTGARDSFRLDHVSLLDGMEVCAEIARSRVQSLSNSLSVASTATEIEGLSSIFKASSPWGYLEKLP